MDGPARIIGQRCFALGAMGVLCVAAASLVAQPQKEKEIDQEYDIKAAHFFFFGLYVDWPDTAAAGKKDFVIGVFGKQPDDDTMKRFMANKKFEDKKISYFRMVAAKDYKPCHLLFITDNGKEPKTAAERLKAIIAKANSDKALIVTETEGLARQGAVINLYMNEQTKVRFEINPVAAKRAGLKISSRLMPFGKIVDD